LQKQAAGEICRCIHYPLCRHVSAGGLVLQEGITGLRRSLTIAAIRRFKHVYPGPTLGTTETSVVLPGADADQIFLTVNPRAYSVPSVTSIFGAAWQLITSVVLASTVPLQLAGAAKVLLATARAWAAVPPAVLASTTLPGSATSCLALLPTTAVGGVSCLLLYGLCRAQFSMITRFLKFREFVLQTNATHFRTPSTALPGWVLAEHTRYLSVVESVGAVVVHRYETRATEERHRINFPDVSADPAYRKAITHGVTDTKQLRTLFANGAGKEHYETPVDPALFSANIARIAAITAAYPGAAPTVELSNGFDQPCLFCKATFKGNGKFKHRLCPHHTDMVYKRAAPCYDTNTARVTMELALPHAPGAHGPYVTFARDRPLPAIKTFPLKKLFKNVGEALAKMDDPNHAVESKTAVLVGYGFAKCPVVTAAKGASVGVKAVIARVGRVPRFKARQQAFDLAMEVYRDLFSEVEPVERMTDDAWVSTVRRKEDMIRCFAELSAGIPVDWDEPFWKAFIKLEKSAAFDAVFQFIQDFKPRLIQAPPDWVHCILGPYMKQALHQLEKQWTNDGPIFYAGCAGPKSLHKWLQRLVSKTGYWFITLDYKMFDCTHSEMSCEFAEAVYQLFVNFSQEARDLMERIRTPQGSVYGVRYTAPKPMNGSGRPDTSLINIVNSVAALLILCTVLVTGKEFETLTLADVRAALNVILIGAAGDDSVLAVPRTARLTPEFMLQTEAMKESGTPSKGQMLIEQTIGLFGFDAPTDKAAIFPDPYQIVFLGHRPYPVGGVWYWGPTLGRRLYKHHTMAMPHGDLRAWLHGVAKMEALCCPHVPILADMSHNILAQLKGHKINTFHDADAVYKPTFSSSTWAPPAYDATTVAHVEDVYGLAPGSVNDFIATLGPAPAMLDHYVIDALLALDDL
jgi:hypothetical protein